MPYDPSIPASHVPIESAMLRGQFSGLAQLIQAKAFEDDCVARLMSSAQNPVTVDGLALSASDPPTQAELQAVIDKLNELLTSLKR